MKPLTINIRKLVVVERRDIAMALLYAGMTVAYFGSLNPWFLWPLGALYTIPAGCLLVAAMLVSNSMEKPVFHLRNFVPAIVVYAILLYYQLLISGANVFGVIGSSFGLFTFLALFRLDVDDLSRLVTFLAKAMGCLLSISLPCFLLHLLGFPFPSRDAVFGEHALYTYTNYYFFMVDDRMLWTTIIPRFHSVFLEPGHLGTATVLLLLAQMGKWKRWYNMVMIVSTLMTFSLAAYVLLVVIVFLNMWCQRKKFMRKLLLTIALLAGAVTMAFFYNNGENLVHDLILIRLEMEDGEMAGDNRVTDDFQADFENFMLSADVLTGREMDKTSAGNSGFRVFIYEKGLIGLALVILLYILAFGRAKDKRCMTAAFIVSTLCFIVRGYPLWENYFIPLLCAACSNLAPTTKNATTPPNSNQAK